MRVCAEDVSVQLPARRGQGLLITVLAQFKDLPARPDARDALRLALHAQMRPILLTNGSEAGTKSLLRQSGLDGLVERVVSVEDIEVFKPRPEVYAHAARQCRVRLNQMALVAVHPWDINGAKAAGCIGAYISAERPFASTMRKPDVEAPSLLAAVKSRAATMSAFDYARLEASRSAFH